MPGGRGKGSRHDGGFLASPADKQCEARRKRAGYLYSKPKVGAQYQASVPKFVKPDDRKTSMSAKPDKIESMSYLSKAAMELQRKKEETTIQKIENWKGDRRCKEYRELKRIHSEATFHQHKVLKTEPKIYHPIRNPVCIHKPDSAKVKEKISNLNDSSTKTASSIITANNLHNENHHYDLQNQFLIFSRNLFLQSTEPSTYSHTSQILMNNNYESMIDPTCNSWIGPIRQKEQKEKCNHFKHDQKRQAVKRKADVFDDKQNDETAQDLTQTFSSSSSSSTSPMKSSLSQSINDKTSLCGLEQDENMLEYIQKHKGDQLMARVAIMVHMSHGLAVKHRRVYKRKRKLKNDNWKKEEKQPPEQSSHKLIDEKQQQQLSEKEDSLENNKEQRLIQRHELQQYSPKMLGNLSDLSSKKYNFLSDKNIFHQTGEKEDDENKFHSKSGMMMNTMSPKSKWKKFLSSSNHTLKQLLTTNSKNVPFSRITSLIQLSMSLPPPRNIVMKESMLHRIERNVANLLDISSKVRDNLAILLDMVEDSENVGIDLEALKTSVHQMEQKCPVYLYEIDIIKRWIGDVLSWEQEVSNAFQKGSSSPDKEKDNSDNNETPKNDLPIIKLLLDKSKDLFLHSKSMVQLEDRNIRAETLRRKILEWNKTGKKEKSETIKFISSLVKEGNRLGLMFPEIELISTLHRKAENWIEHATRAIRYRISLEELQEVIQEGEKLPLNVTDQLDKLRVKAEDANDWIQNFEEKVPCPLVPHTKVVDGKTITKMIPDKLLWLERIRSFLNTDVKDNYRGLLNLSVDGSRIPVDMEVLRLLNLEMEARNWSIETKRLLSTTGRSAKIEEFYAHVAKGVPIRDKAPKEFAEFAEFAEIESGREWSLPYEKELKSTVKAADEWYNKYQSFFGHNPDEEITESNEKCCTSIVELREFVKEGNALPVNLGSALGKTTRILARAEQWLMDYHKVLVACGNQAIQSNKLKNDKNDPQCTHIPISMTELNEALDSMADLPIELSDVNDLKEVVEKVRVWTDQALLIVPKRPSKRNTRGKGTKTGIVNTKYSLKDLISLIELSSTLPIDNVEDLDRLKTQLNEVQSWRLQAQNELRGIITGFQIHSVERDAFIAKEASKIYPVTSFQTPSDDMKENTRHDSKKFDYTPTKVVKVEVPLDKSQMKRVDMKVNKLISNLLDSSKNVPITTMEENLAQFLTKVINWCTNAAAVLPDDILGRQASSELISVIEQGENLLNLSTITPDIHSEDVEELLQEVRASWTLVVKKELNRLRNLEKRGFDYHEWVKKAENFLSSSEKLALSELQKICDEAKKYPTSIDLVRKIRKRGKLAMSWTSDIKEIIENSVKITMDDAKQKCNKGDELGISCTLLKQLRGHMRKSKSWAMKVKKISQEEGHAQIVDIKKLIEEHNDPFFLVIMPDELKKLRLTIRGYCLCRNPYEGFMIACDGCEEWYHGLCVGISEVQANRCEKYLCIRCCISRSYKECVNEATQILRKWKNAEELAKTHNQIVRNFHKRLKSAEREKNRYETEIEETYKKLSALPLEANKAIIDTNMNSSELETGTEIEGGIISNIAKKTNENSDVVESLEESKKKLELNLNGTIASLSHTTNRLESLKIEKSLLMRQIEREDFVFDTINMWCKKVAKQVLVPETQIQAKKSFPNADGTMSNPMKALVEEVIRLKISDVKDVGSIINIFKCLSWSLRALKILSRKPLQNEVESLLCLSASMKLPNERSVKFLRGLLQRASTWQTKVREALNPIPDETKPYDLNLLSQLAAGARTIPIVTLEEARLWSTIEDKGTRHCICGGPGDGTFMLSCDKCERWFHGVCVNLDQNTAASIVSWVCPKCDRTDIHLPQIERTKASSQSSQLYTDANGSSQTDPDNSRKLTHSCSTYLSANNSLLAGSNCYNYGYEDKSLYAPDPNKLWPPIGLFGSSPAKEALGSDYGVDRLDEGETLQNHSEENGEIKTELKISSQSKRHSRTQFEKSSLPIFISSSLRTSLPVTARVPLLKKQKQPEKNEGEDGGTRINVQDLNSKINMNPSAVTSAVHST